MSKKGHIPIRMCVGCNARKQKHELVRVVWNNGLKLDFKQNEPGRGAYVCPDIKCMQAACKKKRFDRALRRCIQMQYYQELVTAFTQWMEKS